MAHRIDFFKVILNIDFFFEKKKKTLIELKELNLSWLSLEGLNFLLKIRLKELNFFFFSTWLKELFLPFFFMIRILGPFFTWLKELNFLFYVTQILELFLTIFFKEMDTFFSGLEVFFIKKKNSQNWIFCESDPTELIFFCELNRLISWIWRKELNRFNFLEYDAKIWTLFQNITQRIVFFLIWLKELNFLMNMTQRFFWGKKFVTQKNRNFFFYDSRIEPFFQQTTQSTDFFQKIWLTELQLLFYEIMTQKN